jgi:hypothetical protein
LDFRAPCKGAVAPPQTASFIFGSAGHAIARSTLAQWVGARGVQLQLLVDALKEELLMNAVLHADETPVAIPRPGYGKTQDTSSVPVELLHDEL